MDKFEDAFKKISKVNLATHIELWGEPKTEKLYFEAGQQSRQTEVDALKNQLIKAGFTDRGGQLLVPPQGKPPCFDLLDAKQAKIDQLKHEKSLQELEINQVAQANQEWQRLVEEKDKRIEELESALKYLRDSFHKSISYEHDLFDKGWNRCAAGVVEDIYRLTGIGKSERGEHE